MFNMKHINIVPHYLQSNAINCGPTCLRIIAKYYGKTFSIETYVPVRSLHAKVYRC